MDYRPEYPLSLSEANNAEPKWVGWLSLKRVQILTGLIFAILLPTLIHGGFKSFYGHFLPPTAPVVGLMNAFIIGFMIMRRMTVMPSTLSAMQVFPAFLVAYSIVIALMAGLRVEFARSQFVMSFAFVTLFFIALLSLRNWKKRVRIGVVASSVSKKLTQIKGVDWLLLDMPSDALAHPRKLPLVVDFHAPQLSDEWERFLAEEAVQGRRIFNDEHLRESLTGKVNLRHISENAMGHLNPDSMYTAIKFYLDFVFAVCVLIFAAPLFLMIGIAIRLDSPGPVLFTQERMGQKGVPFKMYKFRTMNVMANDAASDLTEINDRRVTRLGRFLRRSRVDELPQLINVLRGEMSWIGPRPETVRLSRLYETEIPFYRYRHVLKPGISGWAQVNQGHVTRLKSIEQKLEYDFYYVKHFSAWLDALIFFRTIGTVFTGFGAK